MTTISVEGRSFFENTSERFNQPVSLWIITLDAPADEAVEVSYNLLSGTGTVSTENRGDGTSDVTGFLTGSVIFEPGETVKQIYRHIDNDDVSEGPESVILELTEIVSDADAQFEGGTETIQATSWIYDDDTSGSGPVFTTETTDNPDGTQDVVIGIFNPSSGFGNFDASNRFNLEHVLVRTVDGTATAGSDYVSVSEFTIFSPSAGPRSVANPQFFTVTILPDAEIEGPEGFFIEFGGSFRTTGSPEILIEDMDLPPLVSGGDSALRSNGTSGNDAIDLLTGADVFFALGGDDTVVGGDGNDKVFGQSGADLLAGGRGFDVLGGGDGNDVLRGEGGDDQLFGAIGDDVLIGGRDNDLLDGGAGDDKLFDGNGNDTLRGGAGEDWLDGGVGNDRIFGGNDDDFIFGGDGDDVIGGGSGNDHIEGGRGNNEIDGGTGDDVITSLIGDNILRGGAGNDIISAKNGSNILFGGEGDDELRVDDNPTRGLLLRDYHNFLDGGSGDDLIVGSTFSSNTLIGGSGNDMIIGGPRADKFFGGDGDDVLFSLGRSGFVNSLTGGRGNDTFMFGSNVRDDTIEDFEAGDDLIDVTRLNGRGPRYEFQGELSIAEGLALGAGALWVTNDGDDTMLYGQRDADSFLEVAIRIKDGAEFAAIDYIADYFVL
ncbi:MAG: Calx-beta domain-containing protein [Roseobacter sp.]